MQDYMSGNATTVPIVNCVTTTFVKPKFQAFLSALASSQDLRTFVEVVKDTKWYEVINLELRALEENGTWKTTNLAPGRTTIGCK